MIRLDVWLTMVSGESLKAGSLVSADPDPVRGGIAGQFRYDQNYLNHPASFALDPLNLPLQEGIFNAERLQAGVHGVFEDSLPDDWGRRLMVRYHNLDRREQRVPNLLRLLANGGLGALRYVEQGQPDNAPITVSTRHLQELARLAKIFEQDPGRGVDDELMLLFQAGSSPGGARPKALVEDGDEHCIAKFASSKDSMDVVTLEAATMELGRRAGLEVAETRLASLATGRCLLVKRFDVNAVGGRNHLISMQSLLKADGYYTAGYRELAEVIRHVSNQPGQDLHRLFRQMVFNVLIGNTDDHLKNFLLLYGENGWQLSPAFDLLPNIGFNQEHVLRIGLKNLVPDREILLKEATFFGIKRRQQADDVIASVCDAVAGWEAVFADYTVPKQDRKIIGADVHRRMRKIVQL